MKHSYHVESALEPDQSLYFSKGFTYLFSPLLPGGGGGGGYRAPQKACTVVNYLEGYLVLSYHAASCSLYRLSSQQSVYAETGRTKWYRGEAPPL